MPGSVVTLAGRSGDIMGCIGIKAYHFAKGDERTQPPALDKLWIDIGAKIKRMPNEWVFRWGRQ